MYTSYPQFPPSGLLRHDYLIHFLASRTLSNLPCSVTLVCSTWGILPFHTGVIACPHSEDCLRTAQLLSKKTNVPWLEAGVYNTILPKPASGTKPPLDYLINYSLKEKPKSMLKAYTIPKLFPKRSLSEVTVFLEKKNHQTQHPVLHKVRADRQEVSLGPFVQRKEVAPQPSWAHSVSTRSTNNQAAFSCPSE